MSNRPARRNLLVVLARLLVLEDIMRRVDFGIWVYGLELETIKGHMAMVQGAPAGGKLDVDRYVLSQRRIVRDVASFGRHDG